VAITSALTVTQSNLPSQCDCSVFVQNWQKRGAVACVVCYIMYLWNISFSSISGCIHIWNENPHGKRGFGLVRTAGRFGSDLDGQNNLFVWFGL